MKTEEEIRDKIAQQKEGLETFKQETKDITDQNNSRTRNLIISSLETVIENLEWVLVK